MNSNPTTPHQSSSPQPGWNPAKPAKIPRPTFWPAVLALGIVFLAWGIVTSGIVTAFGLVLFIVSLSGWIGEIRHERKPHKH